MEFKPKLLLVLAVVFTVAGLILSTDWVRVDGFPGIYVALPLGVICFGMFLVTRLLERESKGAVDDQQRELKKAGIAVSREETPAKQGAVLAR